MEASAWPLSAAQCSAVQSFLAWPTRALTKAIWSICLIGMIIRDGIYPYVCLYIHIYIYMHIYIYLYNHPEVDRILVA